MGRRAPATGRHRAPVAAVLVALVLAAVPAGARAAHTWSIGTDVTAVTQHVNADVVVTVQNTSSNDDGGDSIGCVEITIPAAYDVTGVAIDSVSRGFSWSAFIDEDNGSTLVTLHALDDNNRLRGDPRFDILQATITVTGQTVGSAAWSALEYEHSDCDKEQLTQALPMEVTTGSNAGPTAAADGYTVAAGAMWSEAAPGVLVNDTDPESDPLFAVLDTDVTSGTLALATDGGFDYTPDAGFTGTDSFTYHATDGSLSSAPVTVTIDVTNVAPTSLADEYPVSKDVTLVVDALAGLLANDSDPDTGQTLAAAVVTPPASGSLSLATDGSFTYAPPANTTGIVTFEYEVSDGVVTSAPTTVSLTIANDAPVVGDDGYSVPMGILLVVGAPGVLGDDSDANGDTLTAQLVSGPSNGTLLAFAADGSFTYLPDPFWVGFDSFTYRAFDGTALSNVATVTIGVGNDPPVAVDDEAGTVHDQPTGGNVLDNDSDPNGDTLFAMLDTDVTNGVLSLAPDGTWTYTPDPTYVGPDSFTYEATDGASTSGMATVTIDVTNDPPVAVDDEAGTVHDQPTGGNVLDNDSDADGDTLFAMLDTDVINGALSLAPDGTWTYSPDPAYVGPDSFTYQATDGVAVTATTTVTIDVTNAVPNAVDDAYSTPRNEPLVVAAGAGVLDNDTDGDGDTLLAAPVAEPGSGTLTLAPSGAFTFVPAAGFAGTVTFQYGATDGVVLSAAATVTIDVTAPGPTPEPTPEPTPTPTPTPEPTPTPTPEPTPEATPTPTPSPSATPPPTPTPTPTPAPVEEEPTETWTMSDEGSGTGGGGGADAFPIIGLASDTLGLFGRAFEWLVPGALLTVPGILLILVMLLQATGAMIWLPIVRRMIGGFGLRGRAPAPPR